MSLKKLGRYDLIRVLGKGAMGLVYEGRDPNLNRRVAIKTIKVDNLSDEAAKEYEIRFRTEAHSAARLQHPNIVSVYDSDRDGDIAFLVLEFVEGDDLKHHLDKGEVYTLAQTLGIMTDLLSALSYAHKQKIVHRDIKPANLLMQANGRIKLADFGVARIQDSGDATRTQGSIVGTLKYMSPEQLEGRPIDARADLFAAGVVLYQLLTGKRPFDGDTDFAVIQNIVSLTPPAATFHNPGLPPTLDAVVAKSLAKSRDQRFSSAEEFADALALASKDASDATVAPAGVVPARGATATWTATMLASESLISSNSGISTSGTSAGTSIVTQEVELVYWKDVKDSADVNDLQQFLYKFPSGIYADLARRRLRQMGVVPTSDSQSKSDADASMDETVFSPRGGGVAPSVSASAEAGLTGTKSMPAGSAAADSTVMKHAGKSVSAPSPGPTANVSKPKTAAVPAKSNRVLWAVLGVAVVAVAGIGLKMRSPSTPAPVDASVAPAALSAASVAASAASSAAAAAATSAAASSASAPFSSMGLGPGETAVMAKGVDSGARLAAASTPLPAAAASSSTTGASTVTAPGSAGLAAGSVAASSAASAAASAAPKPMTPASAAQRQAAYLARQAASAAAKKAALEKDKPAKIEPTVASEPSVAPPKPKPATAQAPGGGGGPRAACEDRVMFGFQSCMSEQCAKPAFAQHPTCVERRQMDERRREADKAR